MERLERLERLVRTLSEKEENDVVELLREFSSDATVEHLDRKIDDLGIESMDFITLLFDVEEKYSIVIDAVNIDMQSTLREFIIKYSSDLNTVVE